LPGAIIELAASELAKAINDNAPRDFRWCTDFGV